MTRHNHKRGFNLIEAAIVLGVVGLVVGGIWGVAAKFYEDYKVNKFINELGMIVKNTQALISQTDSTLIGDNKWITNTLRDAGVFPSDWNVSGTIKSPLSDNPFLLKNYTIPSPLLAIHFNASRSNCVKVITRLTATAAMSGSRGVRVAGITRPNLDGIGIAGVWNNTDFPISLDEAKHACSLADTSLVSNYIYLSYSYTRINN